MSMKLMYITNDPELAISAQNAGVDRIFVDLEKIGKSERQGHLDTFVSTHTIEDISSIRSVIGKSEIIVRVNPIHYRSSQEIEEAISRGADILMLPMFKTTQEVTAFVKHVDRRAKTCLLLETSQALVRIDEILSVEGVDEIHIGLNDLHISMGVDFMFELLSGDIVEYICKKIKNKGIRYGFGGIARIGQGMVPAENILAEHYRLGSKMVILSRSFHKEAIEADVLRREYLLKEEIEKIRLFEEELSNWTEEQLNRNRNKVRELVKKICKK